MHHELPGRRRTLRTLLGLALLGAVGCGPSCSCQGPMPEVETVTIYVVRHAEKQPMPTDATDIQKKDPPLSREGQLRALGLADDLPITEIDAVYLTDFQRSRQTASAVLAVTGLEPVVYPPKDTAGLVARLRKRSGEQILVVGHSNTIPPLLQQLGVVEDVQIGEEQYGDLWIVTIQGEGPAKLEVRRYGEQAPRPDALR
ncbi:histidine phosphatase family protein [Nannocystaceae bacterium ST9]